MRRDGSTRPADVGQVAGEIDVLRGELGGLVAELDRRRHEALDLKLQLRRHPVIAAAFAAVLALAITGAIALTVRSTRSRRRPSARAREVRRAFARIADHPRRVAAHPSMPNKIATAVGVAVATGLVRRLLARSIPAPAPTSTR